MRKISAIAFDEHNCPECTGLTDIGSEITLYTESKNNDFGFAFNKHNDVTEEKVVPCISVEWFYFRIGSVTEMDEGTAKFFIDELNSLNELDGIEWTQDTLLAVPMKNLIYNPEEDEYHLCVGVKVNPDNPPTKDSWGDEHFLPKIITFKFNLIEN